MEEGRRPRCCTQTPSLFDARSLAPYQWENFVDYYDPYHIKFRKKIETGKLPRNVIMEYHISHSCKKKISYCANVENINGEMQSCGRKEIARVREQLRQRSMRAGVAVWAILVGSGRRL